MPDNRRAFRCLHAGRPDEIGDFGLDHWRAACGRIVRDSLPHLPVPPPQQIHGFLEVLCVPGKGWPSQSIKLAEAIVGLGTEPVRPPRLPLAGDQRKAVEALIRHSIETRPALPKL
ncbi:hypothetical protein BN2476_500103 [Paraburkholderia piptadeniae]|uniref:4-hydroxy-tetrahydrodipicolinate synthase n=1 Tax=Paraburkholderia piptadeniae TaxID=1701573 RepID=A0A1N7SGV8_9BURK|nr:hypothetical protein BN2476_500103 [Paraburkholderia piptadeniae]